MKSQVAVIINVLRQTFVGRSTGTTTRSTPPPLENLAFLSS
uniref:Uncharacterized protein n=1 Tax=Medicago truncatula TaxID=3880 RepID=Q2HSE4_MEDTR|nr:hypothetical protein MtrDRAFT_AC151523g11v2 [Medicago truncatula]